MRISFSLRGVQFIRHLVSFQIEPPLSWPQNSYVRDKCNWKASAPGYARSMIFQVINARLTYSAVRRARVYWGQSSRAAKLTGSPARRNKLKLVHHRLKPVRLARLHVAFVG